VLQLHSKQKYHMVNIGGVASTENKEDIPVQKVEETQFLTKFENPK